MISRIIYFSITRSLLGSYSAKGTGAPLVINGGFVNHKMANNPKNTTPITKKRPW